MEEKTQKNIWKYLDIALIAVSLLLSFFAYQIIASRYTEAGDNLEKIVKEEQKKEADECSDCLVRAVDGTLVPPGSENFFPVAVSIENHPDSRPQAGLAEANLVIEAEVEGGITRFLAFFAEEQKPQRIGPIRSARPYFIDWSRGLSALFVHVGGSPEALARIAKENVLNLNEFYNEKYFWRDDGNEAPHNVYTSGENLNKFLDKRGLKEGSFISWQYKDDEPIEASTTNLKIDFDLPDFKVEWKYNQEKNEYVRYMGGDEHKDESGELLKAKNILIARIPAEVLDGELRLGMNNVGEGEALYCLDGVCREGTWQKKSSTARIRFYNEDGSEVELNRGTSWMEILRPEVGFSPPAGGLVR